MKNLRKLFLLSVLGFLFLVPKAQAQEIDPIADVDSLDWVNTEGLYYEDFKQIAGFTELHAENCEEPSVDVNVGYYQKLFDVKNDYEAEANCKRCQTDAIYAIIYDVLERGSSFEYIKKKLAQQDFLQLVVSDDERLFSIQWNQGGVNHCHYIFVQNVAEGVYHVQNKRLYYSDDFDNKNNSRLIDGIQRVKGTERYIVLIADFQKESVCLLGADLSDNILKKEYMFADNAFCFDIKFAKSFNDRARLIILKGLQLVYPVFEANGEMCDGFLFYNGFNFTDIESYNRELADIEKKGEKKMGRRYRLLSESSDFIDGPSLKIGVDLIADRYTDFKTETDVKIAKYNYCKNDICSQLGDYKGFVGDSLSLYLPLHMGRSCVDGVSSAMFEEQLLSHHSPGKKTAPQPIYVAGYDEAFSYQKVRYTALLFDKKVTETEVASLLWAVEVDGKIYPLDKEKYKGMQIWLDINPKWEGKVIRVIPYVGTVDTHFYCETAIVSRL